MDIHELKQFESVYQPSKEIAFCWLRKQYVQLSTEENHAEVVDHANDSLRIWQAAKAHEAKKLEGCVVVPKDQTEDWYLDDNANMWITEPDEWLCDLYVGEVQSVEHKEYLITKSDTLYAAIVWDDENQDSGTWEFFKTEEEAEKAAAHCKAMLEAARGVNE
ncbi:hypothetical protein [Acinetobacter junii]|uniref:hypothetical protein n=1 Tax=Acinetobacter junii TaxID=40215 RepID=UPI00124EDE7A|nr:hypothetical protein [Acinetobacter junii]